MEQSEPKSITDSQLLKNKNVFLSLENCDVHSLSRFDNSKQKTKSL